MSQIQVDPLLLSRLLSSRTGAGEWASWSPQERSRVVELAGAQDVAPLLYWTLSRSGEISLLPKAEQDRLRAIYAGTRMKNEQNLQELNRLAGMFARAGIPVVALKGICFVLTIYPDAGLRPMVDMDLLVPASRLPEAMQIVLGAGYRQAFPEAAPGSQEVLNHAACLQKDRFPFTTLELHHTLVGEQAYRHAVPVDWFWTQTEPLASKAPLPETGPLLMLTPTAQLLYACAHAMLQHGGRLSSLCWLYDLDQIVRVHAPRLDWELFIARARVFEWSSAACAALSQAAALFDTPVPQEVLDALAAHPDRNRTRVLEMQSRPATHTLEEYRKYKSLHALGRVKLLLGLVVPGTAYMRWRYGLKTSRTLPLWYLYRWWTIFKDVLQTGWMLLLNHRRELSSGSHETAARAK